jgi:hypothetical protein
VESSIGGINGTVFMYGQTGAGKTYTMLGEHGSSFFEKEKEDINRIKRSVSPMDQIIRGKRKSVGRTNSPFVFRNMSRSDSKMKLEIELKELQGKPLSSEDESKNGILQLGIENLFKLMEEVGKFNLNHRIKAKHI